MININFGSKLNSRVVLCLGYFGCVHKGHLQLIERAKLLATSNNAQVCLFTFADGAICTPNGQKSALFTFDERLFVYQLCGVNCVISADFDNKFQKTSGAEFVRKLLSCYDICAIVCGSDYTFGCDRLGTDELKRLASVPVCVVDTVTDNGVKISTENLVNDVINNRIEQANSLLCVPYFVSGNVVCGRQVGRTIGFATANVQVSQNKVLPNGVFAGHTTIDNKAYRCVINVGSKPTFDIDSVTVEVHLIGFDGNLYGKNIVVYFDKFLRNTMRFASVSDLQTQLNKDVLEATDD